jgi:hypothetical protein
MKINLILSDQKTLHNKHFGAGLLFPDL